MSDVQTNIELLHPSRKKPKPGDIFVMRIHGEPYLFGQVVSVEAKWTLAEGADPAILIYIFRHRSATTEVPDHVNLTPTQLLVSPIMTNHQPWSKGYFQTIGNLSLSNVLPRHCFLSGSRGRYYDEAGNELPGPIEPVGDYGLHSFRTIDDQVSDALAIPRAGES